MRQNNRILKLMLVINILAILFFFICMIKIWDNKTPCFVLDSKCLDLTETREIPLGFCENGYTCNDYCQRTYGTTVKWVSKCITDGSNDCINLQGCVCQTNLF